MSTSNEAIRIRDVTLLDLQWSREEEAFVVLNDTCLNGYLIKRDEIDRVIGKINSNGLLGEFGQGFMSTDMPANDRCRRAQHVDVTRLGVTWIAASLRRLAVQESGRYVVIGDGILHAPITGPCKPLARAMTSVGNKTRITEIITWDIAPSDE